MLNLLIHKLAFALAVQRASETLHLPQLHLYRSATGNSCTLYCTAAACLTCSQQRVVYVLAVASPVLALQQQQQQ